MKINWDNVRSIDDEKRGNFCSKIVFKDGWVERRTEKLSALSRSWRCHKARSALNKKDA